MTCENCTYYENRVSDEYYIPEKDDYTWWWYDFCKKNQVAIDLEDDLWKDCPYYEGEDK